MTTVVITGSTSGIGKEAARELTRQGFRVILACRNRPLALQVKHEFDDLGVIEVGPTLDLCSVLSIRAFVKSFGDEPISILVNNAGGNYPNDACSEEGVPLTMQVNYVGQFLLTQLLLPNLRKSQTRPHVINVASVLHRVGKISELKSFLNDRSHGDYPNSKLALVMFTHELQRRYGADIDFSALDPGCVNTKVFDSTIYAYPPFIWIIKSCYSPPEDGALTILDVITAPKEQGKNHFFARGTFTWSLVTNYSGHTPTLLGECIYFLYVLVVLFQSTIDYPLRKLFGQQRAQPVPPVSCSLNKALCEELWELTETLVEDELH